MGRGRAVVKLGIPALVVAVLAVVALWRVGPPPRHPDAIGTTGAGSGPAEVLAVPLTKVADLLARNAIGREATLEDVYIRERAGDRYLWIGSGDRRPIFAVLDADVKMSGPVDLSAGRRVTLIGLVRPAPTADQAVKDWHVTAATATIIEQSGMYLHVTELRQ